MITLGGTAAGIAFAMGGKETAKAQGPPTNASSNDEEKFIQFVNLGLYGRGDSRLLIRDCQGLHK